jgi:hypothetical protein
MRLLGMIGNGPEDEDEDEHDPEAALRRLTGLALPREAHQALPEATFAELWISSQGAARGDL